MKTKECNNYGSFFIFEQLVMSCRDDNERKILSHGHAFLLVYHQGVLLHFNVLIQPVFVLEELCQCSVRLL